MDLPYQIKDRVTLMHRSQSNPFYCLWSNLYWKPKLRMCERERVWM